MASAEIVLEEGWKEHEVYSAHATKAEKKTTKSVQEQLEDAAAQNPFAAAFASETDPFEDAAHNMFNFSPYQLGSVYGEDTLGLLDYEYSRDAKPARPSRSSDPLADDTEAADAPSFKFGAQPPPGSRAGADRRGPGSAAQQGEENASAGASCVGLVLCVSEWRVYSAIDRELLQKEASLVRQAFYVHWIHMLGLAINCTVCGALVLGEAPSAGNGRESIPSFSSWISSIVFLVISSYAGWFLWTRQLYLNVKSDPDAAWTWFNAWFAVHILFTCVLIVGVPGSGSLGIISILLLRNWVPRFLFALVASSVAVAFQGIVLLWSLYLWRQIRRRRQGKP